MSPHDEQTIRAFITPERRTRWLDALASQRRRRAILNRLSHGRDLDERFATPVPSTTDVAATLRALGSPEVCYVMSDNRDLDGRELPLDEAVLRAELGGLGTLISCVPGRLAYYSGESGSHCRMLLRRSRERLPKPIE
jgi:hypothetical protein